MCKGPFKGRSSSAPSSCDMTSFMSVLLRVGVSVNLSERILMAGLKSPGRGALSGVCPACLRLAGGGGLRILRVTGGEAGRSPCKTSVKEAVLSKTEASVKAGISMCTGAAFLLMRDDSGDRREVSTSAMLGSCDGPGFTPFCGEKAGLCAGLRGTIMLAMNGSRMCW